MTNRIRHGKSSRIIIESQALSLSINALTYYVFRNHVITGDALTKIDGSLFAFQTLASSCPFVKLSPLTKLAELVLGQMCHQMLETAGLTSKSLLHFKSIWLKKFTLIRVVTVVIDHHMTIVWHL